jgi:hypothetical protein
MENNGRRRMCMSLALLGLGLTLTGWLVLRTGPDQIAAGFNNVGYRIVWLFSAYAAGTAIGGLPWRWLIAPSARPSIGAAIASRFAASGANVLLPLFGMGGEPIRLLWLPPRDRPRGISAIVLDRVSYCASGAVIALGGVAALVQLGRVRWSVAALAAGVALGTIAAALVALWAIARHQLAGRAVSFLHRIFGKRIGALGTSAEVVDLRLLELLRGPRAPIALALGLHVLARLALACEVYLGLWALGAGSQPANALILATLPILVSPFASWVPAQAGVQEATTAGAAAALGLNPALGVALILLQRIRQLAFVGLASFLTAAVRSRPPSPEPA